MSDVCDSFAEYQIYPDMPIGVMDSGMGGVSVLREVKNLLPNENFIFYGDSANAPYGDKSLDDIRNLTDAVVSKLIDQRVKAVVIACNTASSASGNILRGKYPWLPIVAIEPALKPAVLHKKNSTVLVLATSTTLRLEKFRKLFSFYERSADIITMPLPGLPEFVERGDLCSEQLMSFLKEHFAVLQGKNIDSVVLGCTHYPFVAEAIKKSLGNSSIAVFDGSHGVARQLKRLLHGRGLLNADGQGCIVWENSNPDEAMSSLARRLLELPIGY